MNRSPAQLLEAALSSDPGRPFVTFYDEGTGERIELSVATFANWVAKTANLMVDGLGLAPGEVVHLDLPRHWQTPVWGVAAWSAGLTVDLTGDPGAAALAVCGPGGVDAALAAPEIVACSLRPLGAPFPPGALPASVYDYGREVAGYGDRFTGLDQTADLLTQSAGGSATNEPAQLRAGQLATRWGLASQGRLLMAEALPPDVELLGSALIPLLLDASVVLILGATPGRVATLAQTERVTAHSHRPTE